MRLASDWELSSDAELITAVRSGVSDAFGTLYERHVDAARAVARQYSNSAADAEDAVADAFSRVFSAIQGGGGPDVAFRAYLFTVIRRVALVRVEGGRRALPTDDIETFETAFGDVESTEEPTMAGFERGVVSEAYKSLPERWQAVLWYTEVEELTPAEIAPVLGLTANGVAALAYRAREGLRQAYLQQHLASPASEACTIVNSKLGAYVRGGLAKRETALVDSHLDECGACRALVLELGDVNHGMRVVIAPLVLGTAALIAVKGLGFGGAAGAVGAAAGAGAGAGAAVGLGSGGAGAGAAGGGSLVGAGSGALGTAASGLVAAGAGAAVLVDAVHSAAPAAGAGSSAGSGSSTAGVGAGGAAGAGTTGAGVGTGGFAGFLAGLPAVIGVAAAGVVVAAAVGVAGLLGAFSPNDEPSPPTLAAAAEPDPTGPADSTDGSTGADPDTTTDEATDPNDPTDPVTVPEPAEGPGDATTTPDVTTAVTTPTTPTPTTPPTTPPEEPTPTDPVQVGSVGALSLVSGEPTPVQITVTSTIAGPVMTEFAFGTGQVGTVTVAPEAADFGRGMARAAAVPGGWACESTSPILAVCTNPALEAGVPSTLDVLVSVTDDTVDGQADVAFDIITWMVGSTAPRVSIPVTGTLSSPPAHITVQAAAGSVELTGDPDALVLDGQIVIPVSNEGGTTVRDLDATVTLPPLPAGVSVVGPTGNDGWACTLAGDVLDCTLATLPRTIGGATPVPVPLVLDVSAPDLDLDSASPILDLRWTGDLTVAVQGATIPVVASLSVGSAPEDLVVSLDIAAPVPGAPRYLTVGIDNRGGMTATDVTARISGLPDGALWNVAKDSGWSECTDTDTDAPPPLCLGPIGVGALDAFDDDTEIPLKVPPGQVKHGTYSIVLTVVDGSGARTEAVVALVVDKGGDLVLDDESLTVAATGTSTLLSAV